jgi:hypothetical protein
VYDCEGSAINVLEVCRVCDVGVGLKTIIHSRMLKMPANFVCLVFLVCLVYLVGLD